MLGSWPLLISWSESHSIVCPLMLMAPATPASSQFLRHTQHRAAPDPLCCPSLCPDPAHHFLAAHERSLTSSCVPDLNASTFSEGDSSEEAPGETWSWTLPQTAGISQRRCIGAGQLAGFPDLGSCEPCGVSKMNDRTALRLQ